MIILLTVAGLATNLATHGMFAGAENTMKWPHLLATVLTWTVLPCEGLLNLAAPHPCGQVVTSRRPRVIGGQEASEGQFPWIVRQPLTITLPSLPPFYNSSLLVPPTTPPRSTRASSLRDKIRGLHSAREKLMSACPSPTISEDSTESKSKPPLLGFTNLIVNFAAF